MAARVLEVLSDEAERFQRGQRAGVILPGDQCQRGHQPDWDSSFQIPDWGPGIDQFSPQPKSFYCGNAGKE